MFACFYDNRIGNGYESYLCPQVIFYKVRDTCHFERIDPEIKNAYDIVFDAILNVSNPNLVLCPSSRQEATREHSKPEFLPLCPKSQGYSVRHMSPFDLGVFFACGLPRKLSFRQFLRKKSGEVMRHGG
mgnify:CR=1 FL=1